ncbi:hypothetical protein FHL15_011392 [Xylaria flabelliformis]|uniref:Carrier domain-containing protein n=1 Tax=Xylaria flabelliformis TaxID=2512241 RepID=A0A553HID8_9PEZI|nr:hypothetical protein FHL15_011392 [Xylaria flabelliformis]
MECMYKFPERNATWGDIALRNPDVGGSFPLKPLGEHYIILRNNVSYYHLNYEVDQKTTRGVVIQHVNLASAVYHQAPGIQLGPSFRVLDFASYAFDAIWFNILHTLICGGCVCVPSDYDRQNNNIGKSIEALRATCCVLTPSVARLLHPPNVPSLRTLIFAGEKLHSSDIVQWDKLDAIYNCYGVAECTIACSLRPIRSGEMKTPDIGKAYGTTTWVVHPNSITLASIGQIGELWIEGPLVGQGYLGDPDRTAAAFVQDPPWLLRGGPGYPGRHGRLYRTGDLVTYNPDGSLRYVGRKDEQVKIHGQRVEFGDVEAHIRQALITEGTLAIQVVVEFISPKGSSNPILAAFISLPGQDEITSDALVGLTGDLNDKLAASLPSHMTPSVYLPIHTIPTTRTGKVDRQKIQEIGCTIDLLELTSSFTRRISPSNTTEQILVDIWAEVLNIPADHISTDARFTQLGGDSITAMQVVSRGYIQGIELTTSNILRNHTIAKIAPYCQPLRNDLAADHQKSELEGQPWGLSPIQKLFFELHPAGLNHFNQSFLLRLRDVIPASAFYIAAQVLVSRHAMLRARFWRDDQDNWQQYIAENDANAFSFSTYSALPDTEMRRLLQARQQLLDITQGPVFAIDYFEVDNSSIIVLFTAHHLVVDLVSWRIILHDMERLLRGAQMLPAVKSTFRQWTDIQKQLGEEQPSNTTDVDGLLPFELSNGFDFWGVAAPKNVVGLVCDYDVSLDPETTSLLLGDSNRCLRTEPVDIMVAVLIHSLYMLFPDRPAPAIFIEGHGREPPESSPIDLSETVGWFTALCPVQVAVQRHSSLIDVIKLVKDLRRSIACKGLPYFANRWLGDVGQHTDQDTNVEFIFNYAGAYQQLEGAQSIFRRAEPVNIVEVSPNARRLALVEINGQVVENSLQFSISVHQDIKQLEKLKEWAEGLNETFYSSTRLLVRIPFTATLSDFPLLQWSYTELDHLTTRLSRIGVGLDEVAHIFPCTPLQEGILLSIAKGSTTYHILQIWRCAHNSPAEGILPQTLELAWRTVIARHPIFSVVFVEAAGEHRFVQVQLRHAPVRIQHIAPRGGTDCPVAALKDMMRPPMFRAKEPPYNVTICQAPGGEVAFRLDINHCLIDAVSFPILLTELAKAYSGVQPLNPPPPFDRIIGHIVRRPSKAKQAYWEQYLAGVTPCRIPTTPWSHSERETRPGPTRPITLAPSITEKLFPFCQSRNLTRSTVIQVAWAMTLAYLTGNRDACFGYLASGRDVPVAGVEDVVAPLINLLISRIDLNKQASQVLTTTDQHLINHFEFQHISLAELQQQRPGLHGQQLFNTGMTVRQIVPTTSGDGSSLKLSSEVVEEDSDEFDVGVSVELDRSATNIRLGYRPDRISPSLAMEAVKTLELAITYLVSEEADCPTGSLHDAFFYYRASMSEGQAEGVWRDRLRDLRAVQYPDLPSPAYYRRANHSRAEFHVHNLSITKHGVEATVLVWTAWALLLANYTNEDDVVFGTSIYNTCGKPAPGSIPGEGLSVLPVRITATEVLCLGALLQEVTAIHEELAQFRNLCSNWIRRLGENGERACAFRTILQVILQPGDGQEMKSTSYAKAADWYDGVPLCLVCCIQDADMRLDVCFDSSVLETTQVQRMIDQFEGVLRQLCHAGPDPDITVRNISTVSKRDLVDIWSWNNTDVPKAVEACVHDLITETVRRQPEALAIHAWDGDLTYQELDDLSTRLAYYLASIVRVASGDLIPLCFEKSMWTSVAMLGVMKAGAASVTMDSTYPEVRLRTIIEQAHTYSKKPIILSSIANESLVYRLLKTNIYRNVVTNRTRYDPVVIPEVILRNQMHTLGRQPVANVQPSHILYVVFTSGSTGTPKGAMITHRNFSSAIRHQRAAFGFRPDSRVFDFASYAYTAVWFNILHTLSCGGCVCVPSEQDRRNNLAGAINTLGANYCVLTPSVARLLNPTLVPNLRQLMFAGEKLHPSDYAPWDTGETNLANCYGSAECTVAACLAPIPIRPGATGTPNVDTRTPAIGKACGTVTWVVLPNGSGLAGIGQLGELWIEGPLVGQGYLGSPEQTDAAFIKNPPWLLQGGGPGYPGRCGRLYRTGDLVVYSPNGSLRYIGRKDDQAKIHGQRVELGDLEHHLRRHLTSRPDVHVVAEVARPAKSNAPLLVAFVTVSNAASDTRVGDHTTLTSFLAVVKEQLAADLPSYMVPAIYLPVDEIPATGTGKINRRRLRDMISGMTLEELAGLNLARACELHREPATEAEQWLRRSWASVLGIEISTISARDNFLRIGGDSIAAMRLVAAAQDQSLSLSVADVFRHPCLEDLARILSPDINTTLDQVIAPFSLLEPGVAEDVLRAEVAARCQVETHQIIDVFPCTPLQEGLLALTMRRAGDYVARNVFQLPAQVDLNRFRLAWQQVSASHDILRTRIINLPSRGLVQVICANPIDLTASGSGGLLDYLDEDRSRDIKLGSALTYAALITESDTHYFVWTIHHALYDAWTISLLLRSIVQCYDGETHGPTIPFQAFVQYVSSLDHHTNANYWKTQFEGCEAVPFPRLLDVAGPEIGDRSQTNQTLQHTITNLQWPPNGITPSNIIRGAWAIFQARYSNATDVVFGAVVAGRQAPIPGINRISGPTIATVPVRIQLDYGARIGDFLSQIQSQSIEMLPHEQFGLSRIARIENIARQASTFQSVLVVQPKEEEEQGSGKHISLLNQVGGDLSIGFNQFSTYALTLLCQLDHRGLDVVLGADDKVVNIEAARRMMEQLETIIRQLCCASPDTAVREITVSPRDLVDIWSWNAQVPEPAQACVHDLVAETVRRRPDVPAICAWDGDLTYRELDNLATKLACYLTSKNVGLGDLVPLCFEKSMWTAVAILGVMKTGAGSVILDSTYPEARLYEIVQQVHAHSNQHIILSTVSNERLSRALVRAESNASSPLVIPETAVRQSVDLSNWQPVPTKPDSTLYVVFTSGSTGTPKGVVISHANFSSAITYQRTALHIQESSRVFDFASYAFDISWYNLLHTLIMGGCLCVPSNNDRRNNIAGAIRRLGATYANLTPTVARLICGQDIPSLQTIAFSGEKMTQSDIRNWDLVQTTCLNLYGPAECTVIATVSHVTESEKSSDPSIGKGHGVVTWVVLPDGTGLAGIGQVGELWLEGPLVSHGYLGDPQKTAAVFVKDPPWLLEGGPGYSGRRGRLYRTGDLVFYNPDGSIQYIGRNTDEQVKIYGQRVELGDVEYHLRLCLDSSYPNVDVVAEVITPVGSSSPLLAAFLTISPIEVAPVISCIEQGLSRRLPAHMVPGIYIPVEEIPMTGTGKTDRRRLREMFANTALDQLGHRNPARPKQPPKTRLEHRLCGLWASILRINATHISTTDHFLHLGGDSVTAMKLVAAAHEEGLSLSVARVFQYPILSDMSAHLVPESTPFDDVVPFSLVDVHVDTLQSIVCAQNGRPVHISDVLPTTEFQQECLVSAASIPLGRTYHFFLDFSATIQPDQLAAACNQLWQRFDILRVIFVRLDDQYLQIVPQGTLLDLSVRLVSSISEACRQWCAGDTPLLQFGKSFVRMTILQSKHATRLMMRLCHAQYDGLMLQQIMRFVEAMLNGTPPSPVSSFAGYMQYVQNQRRPAAQYWRDLLHGSEISRLSFDASDADTTKGIIKHKVLVEAPRSKFTPANTFVATCALAISELTESRDVTVGLLVSGRAAHPRQVDIAGPCINIVPVRVRFDDDNNNVKKFEDVIEAVQRQRVAGLAFEASQLSDIARSSTDWGPDAQLGLGFVLQFQNIEEHPTLQADGSCVRLEVYGEEEPAVFDIPAISVVAKPIGDGWEITCTANPAMYRSETILGLIEEIRGSVERQVLVSTIE